MKRLIFILLLFSSCEKEEVCKGDYTFCFRYLYDANYCVQGDSISSVNETTHNIYRGDEVETYIGYFYKWSECGAK